MYNYLGLNNLLKKNGLYFSKKSSSPVSFPSDGHKHLARIEEDSFWFSHRNNIINSMLKKFQAVGYFFDIGGGNGFVSCAIESDKIKPVLIEPMIEGAVTAHQRGLENVICSNLNDLEFEERMKFAGLFDVIEHIDDDVEFLKLVHSNMDKGGLLFITVPAFQFLWSKIDVDSGHFRRYTKKSVRSSLKNANFDIVESKFFFTYLIPAMLILGRKSKGDSSAEHHLGTLKTYIIKLLNNIDWFLYYFLGGFFPGASIIVVAKKR